MPTEAPQMLSLKKYVAMILIAIVGILVTLALGLGIYGTWHNAWSGYNANQSYSMDGSCNIAVIPISGEIIPYAGAYGQGTDTEPSTDPDTVGATLRFAESDPYIRGAIFVIDSLGGAPASAEEIVDAMKASRLPTVALIRAYGVSAEYLIATGADHIVASPFADVGDIGITGSYLDYSKQNEDSGITYVELVSAPYKDYGSPNKPLTTEERRLKERDLQYSHEEFVSQVAANRNLPKEVVAEVADGSSLPARLGLAHKLIDAVGGREQARGWFAQNLSIDPKDIIFCE